MNTSHVLWRYSGSCDGDSKLIDAQYKSSVLVQVWFVVVCHIRLEQKLRYLMFS